MYTDRDDQLSQLLGSSIEFLDITEEEYRLAVSRYEAVGQLLKLPRDLFQLSLHGPRVPVLRHPHSQIIQLRSYHGQRIVLV